MSVPSPDAPLQRSSIPILFFSRWREPKVWRVCAPRCSTPRFSISANFNFEFQLRAPLRHPFLLFVSCHWLDSSVNTFGTLLDIRVWISSWHVLPTEHHGKYKIRHVVVGPILLRSRLKDTLMAITVRDISRSFAATRLVTSFVLSSYLSIVILT